MIMPAFTTLFSNATLKLLSYLGPLLGSFDSHQLHNLAVLLLSPGAFNQTWVQNFLPSMKTLNIISIIKTCCNFLPVSCTMDSDCLQESLIFLFRPVSLRGGKFLCLILIFCIMIRILSISQANVIAITYNSNG